MLFVCGWHTPCYLSSKEINAINLDPRGGRHGCHITEKN